MKFAVSDADEFFVFIILDYFLNILGINLNSIVDRYILLIPFIFYFKVIFDRTKSARRGLNLPYVFKLSSCNCFGLNDVI